MVIPDPKKIRSFRDWEAFDQWLRANHDRENELWLKIHKKGSGLPSISADEAVDVALCWGWIDGLRKGFDQMSFLQRLTPRKLKSAWSQINRDRVARLVAAGRMTPYGQRHVDAARADGRWDQAYAPIREASAATIPPDLRAAIEADSRARKTFRTLNRMNLFALAFRVSAMKTQRGRERKILALVQMLARGETIVPQSSKRKAPVRTASPHKDSSRKRSSKRARAST